MHIELQRVFTGTQAGDDTGTKGRSCFEIMNANSAVIEGALEDAELKSFVVKCYGKDTLVEVAEAIEWWRQSFAFVLVEVRAAVFAEQSGDDIQLDVLEDGVSILGSIPLVIPAGSDTSVGHSPVPDVTDIILEDNAKMTIDVVSVGSGATAMGLEVTLIGYVILLSI